MATASLNESDATPVKGADAAVSSGPQPGPERGSTSPSGNSLDFLLTAAGQRRIVKLLELGLNEHQLKLNRDYLADLKSGFVDWLTANLQDAESRLRSVSHLRRESWLLGEAEAQQKRQGSQAPRFLCDFLVHFLHESVEQIKQLKAVHKLFQRSVAAATQDGSMKKRSVIVSFAGLASARCESA